MVVSGLTRRDLLTTFLGAPVAAAACRARSVAPLPPGEIVGASDAVGHKLRTFGLTERPAVWESHDVVIAGAGIAGLAAAWRLTAAGVRDVVLLELEPEAGGTARSARAFPWGAHYVIAPSEEDRVTRRLLSDMGVMHGNVIGEQFLCRDPQERLFYRGRWYEGLYLHAGASDDDLRQLARFEEVMAQMAAFRDIYGRRAFTIPVSRCSDDSGITALDRMSMADWMDRQGFTSSRLRWLVDYACRDDYGMRLEETSAWAAIFYFAAHGDRPAITWPEGNGRIVAHLKQYGTIRAGMLAASITSHDEGVDVIALRGDQLVGIAARRVIFAGPQFVAPYVIREWRETPPPHVREFEYGSWMVANLALRSRPAERSFPLAWDNVLYDSPSLGYVVATHQRGVDHGPTTLTYYYPLTGADPRAERQRLLSAGRDEWADIALADLERAHPEIRDLAARVDVMRWGHAMVRPRPRFVWSDARRQAAQPYRGIHFANTDLSGLALCEEALDHGVRAAEEVLMAMRDSVDSWRA